MEKSQVIYARNADDACKSPFSIQLFLLFHFFYLFFFLSFEFRKIHLLHHGKQNPWNHGSFSASLRSPYDMLPLHLMYPMITNLLCKMISWQGNPRPIARCSSCFSCRNAVKGVEKQNKFSFLLIWGFESAVFFRLSMEGQINSPLRKEEKRSWKACAENSQFSLLPGVRIACFLR